MCRAGTLLAGDVSPTHVCEVHIREGAHFAVVDDMAFIHDVINRELQACPGSARDQGGEVAW